MVLSNTESHWGEHWRGSIDGSNIEQKIATFSDNDTVSEQVKDEFSSQVILGWEDAFQVRFSRRWASISTPDNKKWIPGFLKLMLNWSRACWSNQSNKSFGLRRYSLQHHQLQLYMNNWYNAPRAEVLIDRSKLGGREIILSKNNDTIVKWLDR